MWYWVAQNLIGKRIGLASRWRNFYYRNLGVNFGGYVWLNDISIPRQAGDVTLEAGVALDDGVTLLCEGPRHRNKLVIRAGTYINRFTVIEAHSQIEIGAHCMIGPHCYLSDAVRPARTGRADGTPAITETRPIILEENVWLGAHVRVMPGVRIGHSAVIGAGAVVETDIPPEVVAAGSPARVLRPLPESPLAV